MKKYLGIVKIYDEYMGGVHIVIKSRTYDDKSLINDWFNLYFIQSNKLASIIKSAFDNFA